MSNPHVPIHVYSWALLAFSTSFREKETSIQCLLPESETPSKVNPKGCIWMVPIVRMNWFNNFDRWALVLFSFLSSLIPARE